MGDNLGLCWGIEGNIGGREWVNIVDEGILVDEVRHGPVNFSKVLFCEDEWVNDVSGGLGEGDVWWLDRLIHGLEVCAIDEVYDGQKWFFRREGAGEKAGALNDAIHCGLAKSVR